MNFLFAARAVTDAVVNSTLFQASKSISCYLSMPNGELDTGPLVSAILAAGSSASRRTNEHASRAFTPGKVLYVPKLGTSGSAHPRMDMLRVYDQPDLDSFPSGLWGIREPPYEKDGKGRSNGAHPFTFLTFPA